MNFRYIVLYDGSVLNYFKRRVKCLKENNQYRINSFTMALIAAKHMSYQTIILDARGVYVSTVPIISMMKMACNEVFSNYKSRRDVGRDYFNHYKKSPIVIDHEKGIYAWPTKSPSSPDCMYIFQEHVTSIDNQKYPTISFSNKMTLQLNCSNFTYNKQKDRAAVQMLHYQFRHKQLMKENQMIPDVHTFL